MSNNSAEVFALTMPATPSALHEVRSSFNTWLTDAAVAPLVRSDVVLAVDEAIANCVEHAIPQSHGTSIEFSVIACVGSHELFVTVADNGRWRGSSERNETRGRGIPLMVAMMSNVDIATSTTGTKIQMSRTL